MIIMSLLITSTASATLTLTQEIVANDVVVSVISDDGYQWSCNLYSQPGVAFDSFTIESSAGTDASFQEDPYLTGGARLEAFNESTDGFWLDPGVCFTLTYSIDTIVANGNSFLLTLDTGDHSSRFYELMVVPEPMTLSLLGLGGLFLRRRRA